MGQLVYTAISSLDGFIEDADGRFDWAVPDDEVHGFINDLQRSVGTYLYGRRMYETMAGWETDPSLADQSPLMRDFAEVWRAADKIVYSRTVEEARTSRTRIERTFDPNAIRRLKETTNGDLAVAGPGLAAHALRTGLVDVCQLFVVPEVVGSGKRALPDDVRIGLELRNVHAFGRGTVLLDYRVRT